MDADPLRKPRIQPVGPRGTLSDGTRRPGDTIARWNNLVAKEYVAAQDPDDPGVLILSRFAGAAINFRHALLVNPYDAESVASALAQALGMPLEERRARHKALFANVCEYDVERWQREFLMALRGGSGPERFQSLASNGEFTSLKTSGPGLAPFDQLAQLRE